MHPSNRLDNDNKHNHYNNRNNHNKTTKKRRRIFVCQNLLLENKNISYDFTGIYLQC